jgi:hypothetical protein
VRSISTGSSATSAVDLSSSTRRSKRCASSTRDRRRPSILKVLRRAERLGMRSRPPRLGGDGQARLGARPGVPLPRTRSRLRTVEHPTWQRPVRALFHRILSARADERAHPRRGGFVGSGSRAQVRSLVASHGRAGDFLEHPVLGELSDRKSRWRLTNRSAAGVSCASSAAAAWASCTW